MRELWGARTSMKRDAQNIVKTHYNVNELIQPETQKAHVKELIGTSDRLLATYLCGVIVSTTHPFHVLGTICLILVNLTTRVPTPRVSLSIVPSKHSY